MNPFTPLVEKKEVKIRFIWLLLNQLHIKIRNILNIRKGNRMSAIDLLFIALENQNWHLKIPWKSFKSKQQKDRKKVVIICHIPTTNVDF